MNFVISWRIFFFFLNHISHSKISQEGIFDIHGESDFYSWDSTFVYVFLCSMTKNPPMCSLWYKGETLLTIGSGHKFEIRKDVIIFFHCWRGSRLSQPVYLLSVKQRMEWPVAFCNFPVLQLKAYYCSFFQHWHQSWNTFFLAIHWWLLLWKIRGAGGRKLMKFLKVNYNTT